jgi:catechol 2,3-dioxygenase-like lactoylglutathione lyase family enzyme
MKLLRLAHVNLSVDDVEAAHRFYGEVLGLKAIDRPADAGRAGCWFRLGEVEIHLSEERADNAKSKRHVAFEVEGLDAWRARFGSVEDGRPIPGMRRLFVRDPAGNRLEFYEKV